MSRQTVLLVFQALIPLMQITLFCLCVGHELFDVPVTVVNDEGSTGLAQNFVANLDRDILRTTKSTDYETGLDLVKSGENYVMLHLKDDFTNCTFRRLQQGLDADNETVLCSSVSAHFDYSNKQVYVVLYRSLIETYTKFFEQVLVSINKTAMIARLPVDMNNPIYGTLHGTYAEYLIPGIIIVIAHYMASSLTSLKLIKERNNGMEEKLWISGVTKTDLLFSHIFCEMFVVLIQTTLVLICTYYVFQLPLRGSIVTLAFLAISQGAAGLCFGLFLSCLFKNENEALITQIGIMFASLLMGGVIWPINGMHVIMRSISYFLPVTMATEAIKAIMSRGWGLGHLTVILGFFSSFAWAGIFIGMTILKVKFFP